MRGHDDADDYAGVDDVEHESMEVVNLMTEGERNADELLAGQQTSRSRRLTKPWSSTEFDES